MTSYPARFPLIKTPLQVQCLSIIRTMSHRIKVRVPVEKRGFFGRKKIVYEERTIVVDSKTYRKIKKAQDDTELDEFLDFMEEMDLIDEMMDDF